MLLGSSGVSWGADYKKGYAAYESGDFATALREWTSLAKQGNANAQNNLGGMYAIGQGVIRDYVYAHMWTNLAASNGNKNGGKLRDFIAKQMTSSQIEKAKKLVRECVRKKYKGC